MKRLGFITTFSLIVFFTFGVFVFRSSASNTQTKSYSYPSIDFIFNVNEDSTVDVTEEETFNFIGEYHEGWRSLLLNKVDDITDISVVDGSTNMPLQKVNKELDKTNSNNWGKYTVTSKSGEKDIIWYYNESDTTHAWILHYKLHGAIGFYKDHDELYWNLLTDFTVPIANVSATVILPKPADINLASNLSSSYRGKDVNPLDDNYVKDSKTLYFSYYDVAPNESITISPAWDKGIVDHRSYWKDFFRIHLSIILGFLFFILSLLFVFIRWYILEKLPMKRMTIVPQYEPPENLPPALGEVVMKEHITSKAWPATIVDFACRGYLTIEEIPRSSFFFVRIFSKKDYILKKTNKNISDLLVYEQQYYNILFENSNEFSTFSMRKSHSAQKHLYNEVKKITDKLYEDTETKTDAFTVKPIRRPWLIITPIAVLYLFLRISEITSISKISFMFIGIIFSIFVIVAAILNPRLNSKGRILKADWLGFKMYLETAERYRMQNLTPDMFEKYLPYAIIFGVEKKWAKAFNGMQLSNPAWYSGYTGVYLANSTSSNFSSFSASSFASSFSSSFASAFSSSGAGGGGGGGAGGGGGGGAS